MKTKINLNMMFSAFDKLNDFEGSQRIIEVSVHQNQITLVFDSDNIIYMDVLADIEKIIDPVKITDITLFDNVLRASCRNLNDLTPEEKVIVKNPFCLFKWTIDQISDVVCKCPSLEFSISDVFIKCYIDKPNIALEDLVKLDNIFNAKGVLELGHQRAYVLYPRTD